MSWLPAFENFHRGGKGRDGPSLDDGAGGFLLGVLLGCLGMTDQDQILCPRPLGLTAEQGPGQRGVPV